MSLTRKDIQEIMQLLENSRFGRLSLEMEGLRLELERGGSSRQRPSTSSGREDSAPAPSPPAARAGPVGSEAGSEAKPRSNRSQPARSDLVGSEAGPGSEQLMQPAAHEGLIEVKSPLLGVFYRAPKPGEPPFVEVGDRVEAETVIGIIEVMKLMNSARAGTAGEVVEIVAQNGEMVEHGEVLMLVRPN